MDDLANQFIFNLTNSEMFLTYLTEVGGFIHSTLICMKFYFFIKQNFNFILLLVSCTPPYCHNAQQQF